MKKIKMEFDRLTLKELINNLQKLEKQYPGDTVVSLYANGMYLEIQDVVYDDYFKKIIILDNQ